MLVRCITPTSPRRSALTKRVNAVVNDAVVANGRTFVDPAPLEEALAEFVRTSSKGATLISSTAPNARARRRDHPALVLLDSQCAPRLAN